MDAIGLVLQIMKNLAKLIWREKRLTIGLKLILEPERHSQLANQIATCIELIDLDKIEENTVFCPIKSHLSSFDFKRKMRYKID